MHRVPVLWPSEIGPYRGAFIIKVLNQGNVDGLNVLPAIPITNQQPSDIFGARMQGGFAIMTQDGRIHSFNDGCELFTD